MATVDQAEDLPPLTRTARLRLHASLTAFRWRMAAHRLADRYRRSVLTVAGLALLSASAWTLHTAAGLAAAGVSCLVLEYLTSPDAEGDSTT